MKALWSLGQATVHQIRKEIEPRRLLAYTTVMTVMNRLARKGIASREKQGRSHLYHPEIAEQAVRSRAVEKLINNFFEGSPQKLLEYLRAPSNGRDGSGNGSTDSKLIAPKSVQGPGYSANEGIDPSLL